MATRHLRRDLEAFSFQQSTPVFARRPFRANGRDWQKGETFPWRELGIDPRKIERLFRSGILRHREADALVPPARKAKTSSAPYVVPERTAEELLAEKALDAMTIRELRIVAKHYGAPSKGTKGDQLAAIEEALREKEAAE